MENYWFNYKLWCKKPSATFVLLLVVVVVVLLLLFPGSNPTQWQNPAYLLARSSLFGVIWVDVHIMHVFGYPVHPSLLW